jgi:hypothetical protein
LIVSPNPYDYGRTTRTEPYKTQKFTITNASTRVITVTNKYLELDTNSFKFISNKPGPIVLGPNQVDTVEIKFFPSTSGRKNATFVVVSNDSLSPIIYDPITGFAGDKPLIWTNMQIIDFGTLRDGQFKDTTLVIRNDGSLDLNIFSKILSGLDKDLFTISGDFNPLTLRPGDSQCIKIRFNAKYPLGEKSGKITINNNDIDNPEYPVLLYGRVAPNYIQKNTDRIVFDTITLGYFQDSTFFIWNANNVDAIIKGFTVDGPNASSFIIDTISIPFTVKPGDTVRIKIKFQPGITDINSARIVIHTNDPILADQQIMLVGWGKDPKPEIQLPFSDPNKYIDFFAPIFGNDKYIFPIGNNSKYSKLRIDSIYFDSFDKQPFSCVTYSFPHLINPKGLDTFVINFNPQDKVKEYAGYMYIWFNDISKTKTTNFLVKIRIRGYVTFPNIDFGLTPVLEVGKVQKDSSKTVFFSIINRGQTSLRIDSMALIGGDADEFRINKKYPFYVESDTLDTCSVTFYPKRVGSKDAKIWVYSNDLFKIGEIKIWAECVMNNNPTEVVNTTLPTSFKLNQNYPNPFNPSTKIEYSLPENAIVTLKIYNSLGNEIETLVNRSQSPGTYIIEWNPTNCPSGIYFYRIQTSKFTAMKKMLLLK